MSKKINILVVIPNDSLGGAEQYLKMVADYFKNNRNANVYLIFFKKRKTGSWDNSGTHFYYGNTNKERYGLFSVIRQIIVLRNISFEYTFTSHVHTNGLVGFMRKLKFLNTKYLVGRESTSIFSRYTGIKLKVFKKLYKLGYSAIDLLICQSQFMKEQLITGVPYLSQKVKISVIHNPINLIEVKKKVSQKIDPSLNEFPFLVTAGRFISEKGFDILINSFSKIQKQFPELKLIILGEGALRDNLNKLIQSHSLQNKVLMPGFVSNVYPYFKNAKACIVSSRIEGFPNVLLQMMSQNNSVVSTLCAGGIEDIDGLYTSKTNDIEGLAEAILLCLTHKNIKNRDIFDKELSSRTIESFVSKIDYYLNEL